mgnify:CR=1 FL=1
MSEKKKFTLEYEIKSSPKILYSFLNEPNGLAQWFADDVSYRDQQYTFTWDEEHSTAKLVSIKENMTLFVAPQNMVKKDTIKLVKVG